MYLSVRDNVYSCDGQNSNEHSVKILHLHLQRKPADACRRIRCFLRLLLALLAGTILHLFYICNNVTGHYDLHLK